MAKFPWRLTNKIPLKLGDFSEGGDTGYVCFLGGMDASKNP